MSEYIELVAENIISNGLYNFNNLKDDFKRTLLGTRVNLKKTNTEIVNSLPDDLLLNLKYLKAKIDAFLLLLNSRGSRIFLDELKQKISHYDASDLTVKIKLAILEGKDIQPKKRPSPYDHLFSSNVLTYYEGVELDFDIDQLTSQVLAHWTNFISNTNDFIGQMETEHLNGKQIKYDEILVLKPTLWGMGVNLNKLWEKCRNSKKGK